MKYQELGIQICHREESFQNQKILVCFALDKGEEVASVGFQELEEKYLIVASGSSDEYEPFVYLSYRRQGIMTALYLLAEKQSGKKIVPQDSLSTEGQKFWNQKNKSFGV